MNKKTLLLTAVAMFGLTAITMADNANDNTTPSAQQLASQQAPYFFMENKGQIIDQNQHPNASVLYQLSLPGLNVSLKKNGFSYDVWIAEDLGEDQELKSMLAFDNRPTLHKYNYKFHRVDVDFLGANSDCKLEAEGKAPDYTMYYTTGTPEEGAKVYHYEKVVYKNLYKGIDLEFVAAPGTNKPVEYNFIVHAGADLSQIKMRYTGALESALKNGVLVMKLGHSELNESIPASWIQETKQQVKVSYSQLAQEKNSITMGFAAHNLNGNNTLIIDPTPNLNWGTYYGGVDGDVGYGIDTDALGNVLVSGRTSSSTGIATTGAHQTTMGGSSDAFILKLNASGARQWGTFYGGTDDDWCFGITTDALDNILVTGITKSFTGIATGGSHQTTNGGLIDAFVVKFNLSGARQWGTYYGGVNDDYGYGITIDASTNVNILFTGFTKSFTGIATGGSLQTTNGGFIDAFIVKFNPSGARQWGTYYGGTNSDDGLDIATDALGNVLVSGRTSSSTGIATTGAHQTIMGGSSDAFILKLNASGALQWGTYYGGIGFESGLGIATDALGNVLVTGFSGSPTDIATTGAHQTTYGGLDDSFIVKLNPSGVRQWGTYYGGTYHEIGLGIATDALGNVMVTGLTASTTGIASTGSYQSTNGGLDDAFIVKFNASGSLQWGTYYGGTGDDLGSGITTDASGNLFVLGQTSSINNIATTGAHQTTYGGQFDAFIASFSTNNVGINEISNNNLFFVYPNPTQGVINVKVDVKMVGSNYVVYDNTGKSVLTGKIISENTIIELDNLAGGIYLFNIGDDMKQTFKVIKD